MKMNLDEFLNNNNGCCGCDYCCDTTDEEAEDFESDLEEQTEDDDDSSFMDCLNFTECAVMDKSYEEVTEDGSVRRYGDILVNDRGVLLSYSGHGTFFRIPEGITAVGDYAFMNDHDLKSVVVPSTVISLGRFTFANDINLASVEFLDDTDTGRSNLRVIEKGCFYGCKELHFPTVPDGVLYIGESAYEESGIISIKIPAWLSDLKENTFSNCEKLSLVYFASREGDGSFSGYSFDDAESNIEKSVEKIIEAQIIEAQKDDIYTDKNITKALERANSMKSLFQLCNLKQHVPHFIIRKRAFAFCNSLTNIQLPGHLYKTAAEAFSGTNIAEVLSSGTEIAADAFRPIRDGAESEAKKIMEEKFVPVKIIDIYQHPRKVTIDKYGQDHDFPRTGVYDNIARTENADVGFSFDQLHMYS